ncbi:MAG TPA: protein kinase [Phycisphaerae bacterium]|nr:protein kinase [Phycisphaerae bacterium]
MAADGRVQQLLDEILDSGRSAEEVCSKSPELLPQVRMRLLRLKRMEQRVDLLFPPSSAAPSGEQRPPAAPPVDLPRIFGYEVQEVLGRGGIGIVYKAWHLQLNRPVALKMLLSGNYAGAHELERFHREAEAIAALQHPNIVQVYDIGEHDGIAYFTMELVGGGNLARKLAGAPLPARKAAALLKTLGEAIHAAHQEGIIHRDLKPANVLLTTDGTPKITDFGLAYRMTRDPGLTQAGVPLGTPSYMSPEQAMGRMDAIAPATDIYSLGAILYELLTGRPPFRAETATETERQVIENEPAHPYRLNAKVPRDLETICLKCLEKDPAKRYPTAAELVADLRRFLAGEPISARPIGPLARTVRWARRRPGITAVLLLTALVVVVGPAWAIRVHERRAAAIQGAEEALDEAKREERQSAWNKATAALDLALARLDDNGAAELHDHLASARRELELGLRLDRIRMNRAAIVEGYFDNESADAAYSTALSEAGLGDLRTPCAIVAERIRRLDVRLAVVAAMDDWAAFVSDKRLAWLLEVARQVDPDPWRDHARNPEAWLDVNTLIKIAGDAPVESQPVQLMIAMGNRISEGGGDAVPFLKRVQAANPADFWANLTLANALSGPAPAESEGFYRAAIAARPDAAVGYYGLACALLSKGLITEIPNYCRKALAIDPSYAIAHELLGVVLKQRGQMDEAIPELREALRLDPQLLRSRLDLGTMLAQQGKFSDASAQFEQAIAIYDQAMAPTAEDVAVHSSTTTQTVTTAFPHGGRNSREVAALHHELARRFTREMAMVHASLGRLLYYQGQIVKAIEQCRQGIEIDPTNVGLRINLGQILRGSGKLDAAIEEFQEAVRLDPNNSYTQCALGQALIRQGRFEEARDDLQLVLAQVPENDTLRPMLGQQLDFCRRMIALEPRVPKVLDGTETPANEQESLLIAVLCYHRAHYLGAAKLIAAAFASNPELANDPRLGGRFDAVRYAALAGCGQGNDASRLTDSEREHWRSQAANWLDQEVSEMRAAPKPHSNADRIALITKLISWRTEPDFAGIRNPDAVQHLPPAERDRWRALWARIDAFLNEIQKEP